LFHDAHLFVCLHSITHYKTVCPFVLTGKLIVEVTTVLSDAVMCLMKVQARFKRRAIKKEQKDRRLKVSGRIMLCLSADRLFSLVQHGLIMMDERRFCTVLIFYGFCSLNK
jgi:hypothetical protein